MLKKSLALVLCLNSCYCLNDKQVAMYKLDTTDKNRIVSIGKGYLTLDSLEDRLRGIAARHGFSSHKDFNYTESVEWVLKSADIDKIITQPEFDIFNLRFNYK